MLDSRSLEPNIVEEEPATNHRLGLTGLKRREQRKCINRTAHYLMKEETLIIAMIYLEVPVMKSCILHFGFYVHIYQMIWNRLRKNTVVYHYFFTCQSAENGKHICLRHDFIVVLPCLK